MTAARRVVVNADDFGLSPGVSRGILRAFREGVLTSTTMLVNLDGFDDAVALAKANPDLPVGVHLTLLWGRPVSDPEAVRRLVDRDGRFPDSPGALLRRYVFGRLPRSQVRDEFRRQVWKFVDAGLDVDEWVGRFEIESREVFAKRHEVLRATGLEAGGRVADIGAGTGIFTRATCASLTPIRSSSTASNSRTASAVATWPAIWPS